MLSWVRVSEVNIVPSLNMLNRWRMESESTSRDSRAKNTPFMIGSDENGYVFCWRL